jgi:hypothetical protein
MNQKHDAPEGVPSSGPLPASRYADRPKDAAGIVGEAIAVARAAQGPHTIAPTPPAPSGPVEPIPDMVSRTSEAEHDGLLQRV